jgi:hypothetical protein
MTADPFRLDGNVALVTGAGCCEEIANAVVFLASPAALATGSSCCSPMAAGPRGDMAQPMRSSGRYAPPGLRWIGFEIDDQATNTNPKPNERVSQRHNRSHPK